MATSNVPVIKSQGRGRSNSLPTHVVEYLKTWLMDHMHHPYPTDQEKAEMMLKTGIDVKRLNNWFVNNRIRYWKPRMEALQRQQHQRKQTAISTLPLPGPYTRLVSSLVTDICPAPPLHKTMEANLPCPTTALHPLVAVSLHQAPASTTTTTTTTILPTHSSIPSRSSPSIVSDTSVYDEGDWSDGGSVKSSSSKRVPSPPLQPQPRSTVTPSPKLSRKRVLAAVAQAEQDIAHKQQDSWPTKYRRTSQVQWKEACLAFHRVDETTSTTSCQDQDDVTLPTLDEAALLFGFATSQ